jgi:hypothetical protein
MGYGAIAFVNANFRSRIELPCSEFETGMLTDSNDEVASSTGTNDVTVQQPEDV